MADVEAQRVFYDSTRGMRSQLTISSIGEWVPWWGRQDALVYLIPGVVFLVLLGTVSTWSAVWIAFFGAIPGGIVSVFLCVAIPALSGVAVAYSPLRARYVRRVCVQQWIVMSRFVEGLLVREGEAPSRRIVASSWFLPASDLERVEDHESV